MFLILCVIANCDALRAINMDNIAEEHLKVRSCGGRETSYSVWGGRRNMVSLQVSQVLQASQESQLLYYWRFTAKKFVLAPSPLRPTTNISFFN
jgi:hypothetical protein